MDSVFCVNIEETERQSCSITFEIHEDCSELTTRLLAMFKIFIPKISINFIDANRKPIKILEKDICITPPETVPPILILLTPTDDNSTYGEDFSIEDTVFVYEVFAQVIGSNQESNVWNLIKVENIIKTLIINLEKLLKSHSVEFDGFKFLGTDSTGKGDYSRSGLARFKLTKKSQANILQL